MIRPVESLSKFLALSALLLSALLPAASAHAQAVSLVPSAVKFVGTGTGGFTGDSGTSQASVALNSPAYAALDALGDIYLTDTLNNCVRKVDTSGNITTVAGLVVNGQGDTCNTASNASPTTAQGLLKPTGIAVAANGDLYIADTGHNCVRRLPDGSSGTANLVTVAGICGPTALTSSTPVPNGLAIDSAYNLYISVRDATDGINQVLRHTNGAAAATVCVMAGTPSILAPTPCAGVTGTVTLSSPAAVTLDPIGNLYIADTGNNCVREIKGLTTITTAIGTCTDDGTGTGTVPGPYGIAIGVSDGIFISSTTLNQIWVYYPNTGQFTPYGGLPSGTAGAYNSTQDGQAAPDVPLNVPEGLAMDPSSGNLYIADSQNHILREYLLNNRFPATPVGSSSIAQLLTFTVNQNANLSVTTPASDYSIAANTCSGALTAAASGNPPTFCQVTVLFNPTKPGLRPLPLVVSDSVSHTTLSTGLYGSGTGSYAILPTGIVNSMAKNLNKPVSTYTDALGNDYFLESGTAPDIKEILAGGSNPITIVANGTGLVTPAAIAGDAAGDIYVTDTSANNVLRYSPDTKSLSTFVSGLVSPSAAVSDPFGNLYIAQQGTAHNVIEIYAHGGTRVIAGSGTDPNATNEAAANAQFVTPSGLALDAQGDLYISDSGRHRVYYIDTAGLIHFLAGNGTTSTTQEGVALDTALIAPGDLAVDPAGDVYIADPAANRVWVAYAAAAQAVNMVSIIGTGTAGYTGDGGASTSAQVNGPLGVASDNSGNVWIADSGNNAIRLITYPTPTINFGNVPQNTTSAAMTATIWNVGNANLSQTNPLTISNSQFAANSASSTCGLTLLPGAECNLGFTFTPTGTGTVNAVATHYDTSSTSPETINLTGNTQLQLSYTHTIPPETEVYGSGFSPAVDLTYTGTAPTGTITFSLPGQTLCTISGTLSAADTCAAANTGLPVGTYTVAVTYTGDTNYAGFNGTTTLTVTPAPLTVTTDNKSRPYGTPNPTLTGSYTGAVNGDSFTLSFSTTATIASPAGNYPITATVTPVGSASLSNYTVTNPGGTLTVTASSTVIPVVTVNCASRIYGAPNPTFTAITTGTLNGDSFSLTFSTTATITSPPGAYPITATVGGAAAGNYASITVVPCTLTVTQAPTGTSVTTSGSPATIGSSVTFTATVTAPGSTITPSGSVSFYNGSTLLGSGTLSASGVATFSTTALPAGSTTVKAVYPANTDYLGSTGTVLQNQTAPTGLFTIAAAPPTQLIKGAGSTSWQVTVSSVSGFVGPVALTCAGLPSDAACTFAQSTVQVPSNGSVTTTMTTTTTLEDAQLKAPRLPGRSQPPQAVFAGTSTTFGFAAISLLTLAFAWRRRRKGKLPVQFLLLLLMIGLIGITGCGCPNTAYRSYTITITGTSVNGGPAPQTAEVSLAVGQ